MKRLSIIALSIAALVSFGCAQDYLETFPSSSTSPATIFETTENAAMAVNGLNKVMYAQYSAYGQGYNGEGTIRLYIGEFLGDNLMKSAYTSFMNSANGNLYTSVTAALSGYAWYYYYRLVGNANSIIANIDDASGKQEDRDYIKAQALCYRAYAYSNLVQIFGRRWSDGSDKPSCILRLEPGEPNDKDRASAKDVYAQIYADLDEAISLFNASGKANSRKNGFDMDLDVAYAIYARAALTREDWATAQRYAQLARRDYPLMSVADEKAGFCNPTSEWIWYQSGLADETLYYYSYHANFAYNSNASSCRNYPLLISKHLFDQIPDTDIRRGFWLDPAGYEGTFNTNTMKASKQAKDNALYAHAVEYASEEGRFGLQTGTNYSQVAAYMQFKIAANEMPGVGDLCLFRSSEMLLIEAEAQYRQGNESAAQALLVELNATSQRDPAYTCDATSAALMDQIKTYRGIELWGEGFSWFDLKRWGATIDRKTYPEGNWMSNFAMKIEPTKDNWTWMIPQQETNYNKGITTVSNE